MGSVACHWAQLAMASVAQDLAFVRQGAEEEEAVQPRPVVHRALWVLGPSCVCACLSHLLRRGAVCRTRRPSNSAWPIPLRPCPFNCLVDAQGFQVRMLMEGFLHVIWEKSNACSWPTCRGIQHHACEGGIAIHRDGC